MIYCLSCVCMRVDFHKFRLRLLQYINMAPSRMEQISVWMWCISFTTVKGCFHNSPMSKLQTFFSKSILLPFQMPSVCPIAIHYLSHSRRIKTKSFFVYNLLKLDYICEWRKKVKNNKTKRTCVLDTCGERAVVLSMLLGSIDLSSSSDVLTNSLLNE